MLRKTEELLRAKRYASADLLLERHLDVIIDSLRGRSSKKAPTEAELAFAQIADDRLKHPADDGWVARLQGKERGGLQNADETLVKAHRLSLSARSTWRGGHAV